MVVMSRRRVFALALVAFLLIPAAALAGSLFTDVDDSSTHFNGIKYMKDTGITLGCGDGTTFCPKDSVLREQMATFMYRMSGNDPATPASVNADKLDGKDSAEFAATAHTHSNAETTNEPGIAFNYSSTSVAATATPTSMISTFMRVPSDGFVKIEVTGNWNNAAAGFDGVYCQFQKNAVEELDFAEPWFYLDDRDTSSRWTGFSAHRIMPIAVADNPFLFNFGQGLHFVCDEYIGNVNFDELQITATFYASSYAPIGIILPLGDEPSVPADQ